MAQDRLAVLFYIYELPPIGGGVATAGWSLLQELSRHHQVKLDVITISLDGTARTHHHSSNLTIHYLNLGDRRYRLDQQTPLDMARFTIKSYFYTWKLIFSGAKFNLTHTFGYPGGLVSWLFGWKWPYMISLRGVDVPGYNAKFSRYQWPYRRLSRFIWSQASAVIANSNFLSQLAQTTAPKSVPIQVIGNGVDATAYQALPDNKKFPLFTITAGATNLNSKKGLNDLITAFASFHQDFADTRLLLIGDGPERDRLEQQVSDLGLQTAVKFVGRKSHSWTRKNLPKCHILCLPSLAEGMSNAILEGMAAGLPIITTPPSQELINGNGVVVSIGDVDAFTQALRLLYTKPKLRRKYGQASRRLAQNLTWSQVAEKYLSLYQQVVGDNK